MAANAPRRFHRPLSHRLRLIWQSFTQSFIAAPSNILQNLSAVSTIVLGALSLILTIIVMQSKQDIKDMDILLTRINEQTKRQDSLIAVQNSVLIKQDTLANELKEIVITNQIQNARIIDLNQTSLSQLASMNRQSKMISFANRQSVNFQIKDIYYSKEISDIHYMMGNSIRIESEIKNTSVRDVYDLKIEVKLLDENFKIVQTTYDQIDIIYASSSIQADIILEFNPDKKLLETIFGESNKNFRRPILNYFMLIKTLPSANYISQAYPNYQAYILTQRSRDPDTLSFTQTNPQIYLDSNLRKRYILMGIPRFR